MVYILVDGVYPGVWCIMVDGVYPGRWCIYWWVVYILVDGVYTGVWYIMVDGISWHTYSEMKSFFIFEINLVHTQIHGCFKASEARIRLAGFTVNILLIKFLASDVTVSHSGEGYYNNKKML